MKHKNLLAVLFVVFFSSSIYFSQYLRVAKKLPDNIDTKTKIQSLSSKILNKTISLDTFFVPTDYAQIQDAIDVADSSDVVIIKKGPYYQQFSFMGKAITVGSEYLIDEDTSHISKAIVDGSFPANPNSASIVNFQSGEDSNSVLCGLTLPKGREESMDLKLIRSGELEEL